MSPRELEPLEADATAADKAQFEKEKYRGLKVGSLVLGNKAVPPDQELDAEQMRFKSTWKINEKVIALKERRFAEELEEATELLEYVKA